MASGKRQPSKQRRAAQNRAQREALAARRDAARQAAVAQSSAAGGGSFLSRLRRRPSGGSGDRPGGFRAAAAAGRAAQPVGYRAGLSALLMALAGVLFCFTFQVAVDADDEPFTQASLVASWTASALEAAGEDPDASPEELVDSVGVWSQGRGSQPLAVALWPLSLSLALPVIGAAIGFRAIAKRSRSRVVSRALFATLFGALLSQIPIFFLPSVVAMGVAVFQIRKFEMTALAAEQAAADGRPSGEVIEAEVVDDGADLDDDQLDEPTDTGGAPAGRDERSP